MITGANGLLGQHLVKALMGKGYHVIATGRAENRLPPEQNEFYKYYSADISDEPALHTIMRLEEPRVVVHAAAMTQVDECELHHDRCFAVNVLGTANMVAVAEEFSRHFIYISSDFVFDGEKGNYSEEDEGKPVNWYGFTKIQAESMVETCEIPWAIVRTGLVYGKVFSGGRSNIITWVKEKLEKQEKIKVVNDQVRTPTYVEDLAKGILLIIEKSAQGIFHIAGRDILTPYQIALKTADHFGLKKDLIEKVDASSFSQPARRPLVTDLVIEKARSKLGYEPLGFEEALQKITLFPPGAEKTGPGSIN